jgi:hypothetical protein
MMDYKELTELKGNEPCLIINGKQGGLTTNKLLLELIELNHRQGLTGVPVKPPYGAFI